MKTTISEVFMAHLFLRFCYLYHVMTSVQRAENLTPPPPFTIIYPPIFIIFTISVWRVSPSLSLSSPRFSPARNIKCCRMVFNRLEIQRRRVVAKVSDLSSFKSEEAVPKARDCYARILWSQAPTKEILPTPSEQFNLLESTENIGYSNEVEFVQKSRGNSNTIPVESSLTSCPPKIYCACGRA